MKEQVSLDYMVKVIGISIALMTALHFYSGGGEAAAINFGGSLLVFFFVASYTKQ